MSALCDKLYLSKEGEDNYSLTEILSYTIHACTSSIKAAPVYYHSSTTCTFIEQS